jgi:hypothetical protein
MLKKKQMPKRKRLVEENTEQIEVDVPPAKEGRMCECGKSRASFNLARGMKARWCLHCPNKDTLAINVVNKLCECGKGRATFNLKGKVPLWCGKCPGKDPLAINIRAKLCECGSAQPTFNIKGQKQARWCKDCPKKDPRAIDVKKKLCECGAVAPVFNMKGLKTGRWCLNCPGRDPLSINVLCKRCECGLSQPYLNIPGETKGRWCGKCPNKSPLSVNVLRELCECGLSSPSYNIKGNNKPIWCDKCPNKSTSAVNVVSKMCECGAAQPVFNIQGEKKGRWCINCPTISELAIDVKNRRCECGARSPTFNLQGEDKAIWCIDCPNKSPLAVDVRSKKCECGERQPTFGLKEDKKPIWCKNCPNKSPLAVDVKHPICKCDNRAYYGLPGQLPSTCIDCKEPGMLREPRKRCIVKKCKELAIYGSTTRCFCESHKSETDFNLVERRCTSCGLMNILNKDEKCDGCEPNNFKRYTKRKENVIKYFFDANHLVYRHDKIPNGVECGKERPDFVFDCGTHIVIVEVDENQHSGYQCLCEQTRMINLTQAIGGIPVFWIRYNPDQFKSGKKKIDITDANRQSHLLKWVTWAIGKKPQENLAEVMYLFYDNCDPDTFSSEIFALPSL